MNYSKITSGYGRWFNNIFQWGLSNELDGVPARGTGHKLNVFKTIRRRPGCLLNVLGMFNLRHVSRGLAILICGYRKYLRSRTMCRKFEFVSYYKYLLESVELTLRSKAYNWYIKNFFIQLNEDVFWVYKLFCYSVAS